MFLQANRVLVNFLVAIILLSNSVAKIAANTADQSSETITIYNGTSATLQAAIVRLTFFVDLVSTLLSDQSLK